MEIVEFDLRTINLMFVIVQRLSAPTEGKQPKQKKRTKTDSVNNQQMAMKRLQQLEGELMGGEKAGKCQIRDRGLWVLTTLRLIGMVT